MARFRIFFPASIATASLALFGFLLTASSAEAQRSNYILLNRYVGEPGSTFMVQGFLFAPSESVAVRFEGQTVTARSDGAGTFSTQAITVPQRAPGSYPVTVNGNAGSRSEAAFVVAGYYPIGGPSSYYVLPGQSLGFWGKSFAPNERVDVLRNGTVVFSALADDGGSFSTPRTFAVPFHAANSHLAFTLKGQTTGNTVDLDVSIGGYFPQIAPSAYFVQPGRQFSVSGERFAPRESVRLLIAGNAVATMKADDNGRVRFESLTAPSTGASFTIQAEGTESGETSERRITMNGTERRERRRVFRRFGVRFESRT